MALLVTMVKFTNTMVTFSEFPDEITLCIDISGCPNHCKGCHSPWLWEDQGQDLTIETLEKLIKANSGVSCVGFLGGDQDPAYIDELAKLVKRKFLNLKTGWYSGKDKLAPEINLTNWDYIKLGPYIESKGGLDSRDTNQRMYAYGPMFSETTIGIGWRNITYRFWK